MQQLRNMISQQSERDYNGLLIVGKYMYSQVMTNCTIYSAWQ